MRALSETGQRFADRSRVMREIIEDVNPFGDADELLPPFRPAESGKGTHQRVERSARGFARHPQGGDRVSRVVPSDQR